MPNNAKVLANQAKAGNAGAKVPRVCPSCARPALEPFYSTYGVPVHSAIVLPTRAEARQVPRGDIELGFCTACGFISNMAYDATLQDYSRNYEDQQGFSPTFAAFARDLAERLIHTYGMRNKTIVEIGCGKGDFLALLCELGPNRGVGIDPAAVPERIPAHLAGRIELVREFYSEQHAGYQPALICCRHTLEHIPDTAAFLGIVRRAIGHHQKPVVFFEVPDVIRILREQAFWDIYYEHCSYFSPGAMARLFRSAGFDVVRLARAYADQYLLLDAYPVQKVSPVVHDLEEPPEAVVAEARLFADRVSGRLEEWRAFIAARERDGSRVVIWGGGSKCVAFLTAVAAEDLVEYVVDINPHLHGKFLPASGLEIVPPSVLRTYQPEWVVVMNPIYKAEIEHTLQEMGVRAQVVAL